jgi:NADPH:quinone reductase-like Zn-dependent oxidoreductase
MAGEIVALGEGVTQWKVGDLSLRNFIADLVYGDLDSRYSSMGGQAQGVLTQYRTFHSHAGKHCHWKEHTYLSRYTVPGRDPDFLSYEEASNPP